MKFLALLLSLSVLLSAVSSAPQRGNPIIPGAFGYGSGLVALGVAGGIVAPITAPLAKAAIIKGLIIKKGAVVAAILENQGQQSQSYHYSG